MRRSSLVAVGSLACLIASCQGTKEKAVREVKNADGELVRVEQGEEQPVDGGTVAQRMTAYSSRRAAGESNAVVPREAAFNRSEEGAETVPVRTEDDEAEEAVEASLLAGRMEAYLRLPPTLRMLSVEPDLGPTTLTDTYDPFEERGCPPEGSAATSKTRNQNRLKNRVAKPHASNIDDEVTLDALRAPGQDHDRFSTAMAATIEGYCRSAMGTGAETCNCNETRTRLTDTHFEIASGPNDSGQPVIAEVTPVWRLIHKHYGQEDWSSSKLKAKYEGHRIRITGWLFFDEAHLHEADNTDQGDQHGKANWRATCWEIHPITSIDLVQ